MMVYLLIIAICIFQIKEEIKSLNTSNKEVKGLLIIVFWVSVMIITICLTIFKRKQNVNLSDKHQQKITEFLTRRNPNELDEN